MLIFHNLLSNYAPADLDSTDPDWRVLKSKFGVEGLLPFLLESVLKIYVRLKEKCSLTPGLICRAKE